MQSNSEQPVQQSPRPLEKKERDPFLPFLAIPLILIILIAAAAGIRDAYIKHETDRVPAAEKVEPSISAASFCLAKCSPYKLGWFAISDVTHPICYCTYDKESFPRTSK